MQYINGKYRSKAHKKYSSKYRNKPYKKNTNKEEVGFGFKEVFLTQVTVCAILALAILVISMTDNQLAYNLRTQISTAIHSEDNPLPFPLPFTPPASGAVYADNYIPQGDFLLDENTINQIQGGN